MTEAAIQEKVAREAARASEVALHRAMIERQRARYASAYNRWDDAERREKARGVAAGAAIFEQDAARIPGRARKAVEALKLAVFMLDPKAPA